jgi:phage terminase Nu1 subunit (DNA packaging protein)
MAKTAGQQKEPHWLNRTQMAKSLGISGSAFDRWGVQPVARIGANKYFDVRVVMDNRLAHQAQSLQPAAGEFEDGTMDFERLRLTRAQAEGQEIKNELAKGKTAPVEIITLVLSRIAGEASGELDSLPLNIKRRHPEIASQVIESIKRHCVKAQNAISRTGESLDNHLNDYLADLDAG